jgi:plastocyanin
MMRRLRICFDLLVCLGMLGAAPVSATTVTGSIKIVSARKHGKEPVSNASDVVVWLAPVHGVPAIQPEHVKIVQRDKVFRPHTLVIPVGSVVDFPNDDPIYHNAFSNFDGQIFDIGLYAPGTTKAEKFTRPGVVRVFCNIHPSMSALIVVVDTPFFAKAGKDGQYEIANVPAGEYEVHVFDERGTMRTNNGLTITVPGAEDRSAVPPIQISEAGYVQTPHKNKYGLDYSPEADDETTYPASPR